MKKIVVLDAYPFKASDFHFLHQLGNVVVYDDSQAENVAARISDADIVVVNKTKINADSLKSAAKLKFITVLATGYNIIDIVTAKELDIAVANIPGYSTDAVAQHAFAMLLELSNHVAYYSSLCRQDGWGKSGRWSIIEPSIGELSGKTMGIIGFGAIGQQVATIATAFGMQVITHSRTPKQLPNISFVSLAELFASSDVISLHCPLTVDTQHIINTASLRLMKASAFLLNLSRGPLVDEVALYEALHNNIIAGAALDVLSEEPPAISHPLTTLNNCIITPHIAWSSREACARVFQVTQANIAQFLNGTPQNIVT